MNDSQANPPAPAAHPPAPAKPVGHLIPFRRAWVVGTVASVAMVLLAMLGVGLTMADHAFAPTYWMCLVPVFGLVCIATAWLRVEKGHKVDRGAILRQLLHWAGIGVALGLDFFIRRTGVESAQAAGLTALLVLALGCYLAGVHLEWLFIPVGVLLTLTLIVVAKAEQYLWVVVLVGVVTIAALFAGYRLLHRLRHDHAPSAPSPPAAGH